MKKKLILLAVLSVVMAIFFVACGGTGGGGTATAGGGAAPAAGGNQAAATTNDNDAAEVIEISFWHTWGAGTGLDALEVIVAKYNEINDRNIRVTSDFVAHRATGNTQTMDQLMAAIASGDPPNIALLDNFQVPTWAAQDALIGLRGMMSDRGESLDHIYDFLREGSYFRGDYFSIPFNTDVRALFYNRDLFAAAGITSPPRTIAELGAAAHALTTMDGNRFEQVGFIPWQNAGRPLYTWGWSFGGEFWDSENNVMTLDDPQIIAAAEWIVEFARGFGITNFVEMSLGFGAGAEDPFVSEFLAMAVRGNFDIGNLAQFAPDLNYGIAPIPSLVEGENITWAGGWAFVIPRGASHQEDSLDFMMFAMSEEAQIMNLELHTTLAVHDSVNMMFYADDPLYETFLSLLPYARIRPPIPIGQMVWDGLIRVLENSIHEMGEPADLLRALNQEMNEELRRFDQ